MEQDRIVERRVQAHYWFIRHGEPYTDEHGRREDRLTPLGELQARATGKQYLTGISVDGILTSGRERATRTIVLACEEARIKVPRIETVEAIGFDWIGEEVPTADFYETERKLHEEYGGPRQVPIFEWLNRYSHSVATRGRITEFLHGRTKLEVIRQPTRGDMFFVGGSHGPTAATAALDTKNTYGLGFGDVVAYYVEAVIYRGGVIETSIKNSQVMWCPAY